MSFSTVVTHDTAFHADEVIAVALLRQAGFQFEITRTRDPKILGEAIADNNILVLDVGGVYDPAMLNFDHHQALDTQLILPNVAGKTIKDLLSGHSTVAGQGNNIPVKVGPYDAAIYEIGR